MANNLKSFITVKGNEEVIKLIDSLVDKVRNSEDDNVVSFATTFYDDVELSEDGGSVMNTWSNDNLGAKWTTFYDEIGEGEFSIESAWYPPTKFFARLFEICFPLDNDVVIEVTYEDESYSPIGAVIIKGVECDPEDYDEKQGMIWVEEDRTLEDPTVDKDWDDEDYDDVQMKFAESVYDRQQELLEECRRLIDTDGMFFDDYEEYGI
jgi:hypothetical protein